MFKNSKYGKFLTVLLIIVIIVIVGLIGFLGYDLIKNIFIDNDAKDAVEQFESSRVNRVQRPQNETAQTNEIVAPPTVENTPTPGDTGNSDQTATYKGFPMVGTIKIPKTGIEYPILESVTPKAIEVAVGILGENKLNQPGNTTIIGHNYRNGTFFSNNSKIEIGDKIYITDSSGQTVEYTVYNKYITADSDGSYMIRDTQGKREISLSTCTSDVKQRLVIWASAD